MMRVSWTPPLHPHPDFVKTVSLCCSGYLLEGEMFSFQCTGQYSPLRPNRKVSTQNKCASGEKARGAECSDKAGEPTRVCLSARPCLREKTWRRPLCHAGMCKRKPVCCGARQLLAVVILSGRGQDPDKVPSGFFSGNSAGLLMASALPCEAGPWCWKRGEWLVGSTSSSRESATPPGLG